MSGKQPSIHSKSKKGKYFKIEDYRSSALKIKPCEIDSSTLIQVRNKSICCSSSQTRIDLRQSFARKPGHPRAFVSCQKIKTE